MPSVGLACVAPGSAQCGQWARVRAPCSELPVLAHGAALMGAGEVLAQLLHLVTVFVFLAL